jgi:hypothetical protein
MARSHLRRKQRGGGDEDQLDVLIVCATDQSIEDREQAANLRRVVEALYEIVGQKDIRFSYANVDQTSLERAAANLPAGRVCIEDLFADQEMECFRGKDFDAILFEYCPTSKYTLRGFQKLANMLKEHAFILMDVVDLDTFRLQAKDTIQQVRDILQKGQSAEEILEIMMQSYDDVDSEIDAYLDENNLGLAEDRGEEIAEIKQNRDLLLDFLLWTTQINDLDEPAHITKLDGELIVCLEQLNARLEEANLQADYYQENILILRKD